MTATSPRRIRLQERDVDALVALGGCGCVNGPMFHQECFPTMGGRAFRRRMTALEENGLIGRVTVSHLSLVNPNGRPPSIFVLTDKGADIVCRHTGTRPKPLRMKANPFTLQHRLEVAQLQLTFLKAIHQHELGAGQWINEWNTSPSSRRDASYDQRFVLYESFDVGVNATVSCRPDAAFRIDYQQWSLLGYCERDRSTETLKQFSAKTPGYEALVKQRRFEKHFPDSLKPIFRLYVVCESRERITNLRGVLKNSSLAQSVRFAEATELRPDTVLAQPVWCDIDGNNAPIFPSLG